MYTCEVLANRKAKNKYVEWLSIFFPGRNGKGQLQIEDDAIEQYRESLGDLGLLGRCRLRIQWKSREHVLLFTLGACDPYN